MLSEDLWALEEEQLGYTRHPDEHHYEFNPIVKEFQKMTLEKWEQYLDSESQREQIQKETNHRFFFPGAGLTRQDLKNNRRKNELEEHPEKEELEESVK